MAMVEASAATPPEKVEQTSTSEASDVVVENRGKECRNLFFLAIVFTCYFGLRSGSLVVLPMACKSLLSAELGGASHSALYELPLALWMVFDIFLAGLNARVMQAYGRRAGFMLGSSVCFFGCVLSFLVLRFLDQHVWLAFILLNVAVLVISAIGVGEFVRYAAAEAVKDDSRRSDMVSLTIAGGAIASTVGPISASVSSMLDPESELHGDSYYFLFAAGFCLISLAAGWMLELPSVSSGTSEPTGAANIWSILMRRKVWTAILAQVGVQFAMVAPMTAVPLAMQIELTSVDLDDSDWTISGCVMLHVFGMFSTGLVTGYFRIGDRLGANLTMCSGLLIQGIGMVLGLLFTTVWSFYVALYLIGVGWNIAFVAGTMLLLRSHSPEERMKVGATNEGLRFTANAIAALLSSSLPWRILLIVSLVTVAVVALVMVASQERVPRISEGKLKPGKSKVAGA